MAEDKRGDLPIVIVAEAAYPWNMIGDFIEANGLENSIETRRFLGDAIKRNDYDCFNGKIPLSLEKFNEIESSFFNGKQTVFSEGKRKIRHLYIGDGRLGEVDFPASTEILSISEWETGHSIELMYSGDYDQAVGRKKFLLIGMEDEIPLSAKFIITVESHSLRCHLFELKVE